MSNLGGMFFYKFLLTFESFPKASAIGFSLVLGRACWTDLGLHRRIDRSMEKIGTNASAPSKRLVKFIGLLLCISFYILNQRVFELFSGLGGQSQSLFSYFTFSAIILHQFLHYFMRVGSLRRESQCVPVRFHRKTHMFRSYFFISFSIWRISMAGRLRARSPYLSGVFSIPFGTHLSCSFLGDCGL